MIRLGGMFLILVNKGGKWRYRTFKILLAQLDTRAANF